MKRNRRTRTRRLKASERRLESHPRPQLPALTPEAQDILELIVISRALDDGFITAVEPETFDHDAFTNGDRPRKDFFQLTPKGQELIRTETLKYSKDADA